MRRALILVAMLLAASGASLAGAQDLPRGQLIEAVTCLGDASQTYALYIPSTYSPDRAWPVLMAFHPSARGRAMVEKYQAAAEQYGYIVAGSNTSRNGPWSVSVAAVQGMSSDLGRRFSIDARRIYLTGMSGGARVAMQVALGSNTIAGVIASSAGFPDNQTRESVPFAVYGTAGNEDFNYIEMRMLDRALTSPHRLAIFSGGHTLPTDAVALDAIEWMELQAMKSGRRPRDEAFVDRMLASRRQQIDASTSAAITVHLLEAVVADFTSLRDVTAEAAKAAALSKQSETKKALAKERSNDDAELRALSEVFELESELGDSDRRLAALARLKGRLAQWARQAGAAVESAERSQARRLLGAVTSGAGGRVTDADYRALLDQDRRTPTMIGQMLSHYLIVDEIGSGGMGTVYKARDLRLDRFVALKFLSSKTAEADAKQRFVIEARTASALDHPNICTVHDIDETPSGDLFIAMAFYEGETLKNRIQRGPLAIADAIDIALQVLRALAQAHHADIVHRDIKPANLMITRDGLVKVLDFGIAKLKGRSDVTRTGTTVGTIAYMSPEQMSGEAVDRRSDLWSVGVVLFEMLAGRRPFDGVDDVAVLNAVLHHPLPAIASARADVPSALQGVIGRALHRRPDKRYPSAEEMMTELAACAASTPESAGGSAERRKPWQRRAVAAAVAIVVVALGVVGFNAYQQSRNTRWAREVAIPEITRLVGNSEQIAALPLARRAEQFIPGDPALEALWPQIVVAANLLSTPEGAEVSMRAYGAADDAWTALGQTPLKSVDLPRGILQFRFQKAGFQTALTAGSNPGALLNNMGGPRQSQSIVVRLLKDGEAPDMVAVPGGRFPVGLAGFNSDAPIAVDEFLIDRTEVTQKAFKEFVDRGGYEKEENWRGLLFEKDGKPIEWRAVKAMFHDSTGRPGPANWELGEYAQGQADYPVGGISWYEGAAYCSFRGKRLPTIYHWARAGLSLTEIVSPIAQAVIPLSNFLGKGAAPYPTKSMPSSSGRRRTTRVD